MYTPVNLYSPPVAALPQITSKNRTESEITSSSSRVAGAPTMLISSSIVSTLILLYLVQKNKKVDSFRSTPLPGWGILGDRVNELLGIFLNALAVYVHNDNKWNNCPQRLLCEANQRAVDYGTVYGILTYLTSLFISFWLQDRRVTASMEAMRKGRQGQNCIQQYPCPVSL